MATAGWNLRQFHVPAATVVLFGLLAADLVFFTLHLLIWWPHPKLLAYSLEADGSYSEFYEYLKLFWLTLLGLYLSVSERRWLPWAAVFLFLLLDDCLLLHERAGAALASGLALPSLFGIGYQGTGELAFAAAMAVLIVPCLALAARGAKPAVRGVMRDFALLLMLLLFFALGVDALHTALPVDHVIYLIFGFIEDGGELVTISLLTWYAFLQAVRPEPATQFLHGLLRRRA